MYSDEWMTWHENKKKTMNFINNSCPDCGTPLSKEQERCVSILYTEMDISIVRVYSCEKCGMLYTSFRQS